MNKVILTGNVVKDSEMTESSNGVNRLVFTLAVNTRKGEKTTTNYIPIVAWGSYAESLGKYAKKGARLLVEGELNLRSFEKDGKKHPITEVMVEKFENHSRGDKPDEEVE